MSQPVSNILNKVIACIYFIGFETGLYFILSYLLFNEVPRNAANTEPSIVKDWNSFIYFILLHTSITLGTMVFLTSALPRKFKPQIMNWYWLSWPGLIILLLLVYK